MREGRYTFTPSALLAVFLSFAGGCASFQPNPSPSERLHEFELALPWELEARHAEGGSCWDLKVWDKLSLEETCGLYRSTCCAGLRPCVLIRIMTDGYHPFHTGRWTRQDVLQVLGSPDDNWGGTFVYTGEGRVGDGMPGFHFEFDEEDYLKVIIPAN